MGAPLQNIMYLCWKCSSLAYWYAIGFRNIHSYWWTDILHFDWILRFRIVDSVESNGICRVLTLIPQQICAENFVNYTRYRNILTEKMKLFGINCWKSCWPIVLFLLLLFCMQPIRIFVYNTEYILYNYLHTVLYVYVNQFHWCAMFLSWWII